jgi:hypothetical protein
VASKKESGGSPSATLDGLAQAALDVVRKASKHRQKLSGDNFYGNKLAQLRTDAAIAFSEMSANSTGDTSAIAELIETSFSSKSGRGERLAAVRELSHSLKTRWRQADPVAPNPGNELFPLTLITKTGRGYLLTITKQMNGCVREGWYDACAVMMRRLVELVIIEAYEHLGIENLLKDQKGDYFQLSALIDTAIGQPRPRLSRNAKKALPKLRNVGHRSAHGRHFTAQRSDIEKLEDDVRVVVEEFLNHAGLL